MAAPMKRLKSADTEKMKTADEENEEETKDKELQEVVDELIKKRREKKKQKKPGVVYLSTVPPGMDVAGVRSIFSKYGTIGRMYLQPYQGRDGGFGLIKPTQQKRGNRNNYCEGWIEFMDKKIAKGVAALLNNKVISGKRKTKYRDYIWNIKYLHRFKWVHLNERVAYERASHVQRMRTEIAQVKKETDYYVESVEKSQKELEFRRRHPGAGHEVVAVRQRETDDEIRRRKQELGLKDEPDGPDLALLQSVFGSR